MADTKHEHGKIWSLRPVPSPEARDPAPEARVPAWERLEAGRYMPRRIRGSYRGRELG